MKWPLLVIGFSLSLCFKSIAQPSIFNWPKPVDNRSSHYDKKKGKKNRPAAVSNKVFVEKKRIPRRTKVPDRVFTETAFSNHVHRDDYYQKRQSAKFSDLNKELVYNRQRNTEKQPRKRK